MVEFTLTKLFDEVLKGHWDNVVDIYEHIKGAAQLKINSSGDTALHKAVSDGREHIVEQLVKALRAEVKDALELTNNHGNTPLHLAAAMGNIPMCKCMTGEHIDLLDQRNNNGHTPLFLTVLHGKLDAFIFLCEICKQKGIERYYRGGKFGATILHTAINGEHFKLAFHIMNNHKELMNWMDERGSTPLHLLADKPSVFRSGAYFGWRTNIIYSCITVKELPDLILPDEINNQTDHINKPTGQLSRNTEFPSDRWFPPNYRKCCYFLNLIYSVLLVIFGRGKLVSNSRANGENAKNSGQVGDAENPKELEDESLCIPCFRFSGGNGDNAKRHGQTGLAGNAKELPKDKLHFRSRESKKRQHEGEDQLKFPPNYRTGIELMKLVFKLMLIILGLRYKEIQKIKHMKEKHVWSVQILKKMLESTRIYMYDAGGRSGPSTSTSGEGHALTEDFTEFPPVETNGKAKDADDKHEPGLDRSETPILAAARTGIIEIVELILKHFPVAIHDMNSQKKNIVLLAAENRQPHLIDLLKQKNTSESVFHTVDIKGNSALHLAANYDPSVNPWTLPGAALQMQWEIKWYEYVKSSVGPDFLMLYNKDGKTAKEIFTTTHKDLVKEGGKWLLKTSDSCSVVAALIATVAFATSATIPGSTEQGKPVLGKELAFQVFAISSLLSLCFSVTSLVMFLAILTSRYQENEFRITLHTRLLWGLSFLLISIAAGLVSFCAGHFFILNDHLKSVAVPIYAVTCLPATLFALAHSPLYFDLLRAIFTKVPLVLYNGRFATDTT